MTSYMESFIVESSVTTVGRALGDDALGEECQCLGCLECRTRRIESHDTAVQEWLPHIALQFEMVLASLTAHHRSRVVGWR